MTLSTLLNFIKTPNLHKLIFFPIAVGITYLTPQSIINSIPFGKYDILIYLICISILISWIVHILSIKYNKSKSKNDREKYINKQVKQGHILTYKELPIRHKELINTFLKNKNKPIPLMNFSTYDFRRDDLISTYKEKNMIVVRLKKDFYNTLKNSQKALID